MALIDLNDEELTEQLKEHGGVVALARHLKVPQSTLSGHLGRRGIKERPKGSHGGSRKRFPAITLEAIHEGMVPPNNCKVKAFLEILDPGSQEALRQALEYDAKDLTASRLRQILLDQGFDGADVPGSDAINDHRKGQRPCRCKG